MKILAFATLMLAIAILFAAAWLKERAQNVTLNAMLDDEFEKERRIVKELYDERKNSDFLKGELDKLLIKITYVEGNLIQHIYEIGRADIFEELGIEVIVEDGKYVGWRKVKNIYEAPAATVMPKNNVEA